MFFLQFCKNYFCINGFCSVSDFLLGFEDCLVDAIHSCKFIIQFTAHYNQVAISVFGDKNRPLFLMCNIGNLITKN